jgi:hypothetical protein
MVRVQIIRLEDDRGFRFEPLQQQRATDGAAR